MTDSAQQYIDLYREQHGALCAGSSDVLNRGRAEAMAAFERLGLPTRRNERYRYARVAEDFAPDYGINFGRVAFPFDPYKAYRCSVPNIGTALYYVVNDTVVPAPMARKAALEGVFVGSLRDYSQQHPDFVARHYGTLARPADDAVAALNTALAQDGLMVHVGRGVKVEQPIQIVNLLTAGVDLMTNRRVLVVLGEGAEATLLCCEHTLSEGVRYLTTCVSEVVLSEGSRLNLYGVEETCAANTLYHNLHIAQAAQSHLEYADVTLQNGSTRRTLDVSLLGAGAETRLLGAVVLGAGQRVDTNLLTSHQAPSCTSEILYKYVLEDDAVGAFAGKVLVKKGAQKTASQQNNANLCTSPRARMFTQPMLEIYADDVKCNHGSTVGQLSQAALFYMAQRGVSPDEARLLLQRAFVDEVLQQIQVAPLRERLSAMVDARFRHDGKACADCNLCKK